MTLTEIAYGTAAVATLALLRFGIPLALTWLIGKAAHRVEHLAS